MQQQRMGIAKPLQRAGNIRRGSRKLCRKIVKTRCITKPGDGPCQRAPDKFVFLIQHDRKLSLAKQDHAINIRQPEGSLKAIRLAIAIALAASSSAMAADKPKLVIQITMDQLRGDLLERYSDVLTHGFTRIEQGGHWIRHGDVDHGLTLSFPGHATLATGMYPSHHGLTANEWWERQKDGSWGEIDVAVDTRYQTLETPGRPGASPSNMLAATLGEWIKASDPNARSVALGTGNRIPVAYAGHHADDVYWYDSTSNEFTSSSYYAPAITPWVATFNKNNLPQFEKPIWRLTVPSSRIHLALPDATSTENFGRNNVFPHIYAAESRSPNGGSPSTPYGQWFTNTPMKDEALFALAAKAVDAERLGQRGVTDYLAIDIDSTDNVGHAFGALSLEQFDTLVRLDHALDTFLDRLDRVVGKGNYVLVLSADHGVVSLGEPGVRQVTNPQMEALLDKIEAVASKPHSSDQATQDDIVATLKIADFVTDAYTEERLKAPTNDPYVRLYKNMLRPGFTTDFPLWSNKDRPHHPARYHIIVRFKENMINNAATAVHGSPYAADRLVPIIFYGSGIRVGEQTDGARTVDVAPTLAAAAGIAMPKDLDGRVLSDVLAAH